MLTPDFDEQIIRFVDPHGMELGTSGDMRRQPAPNIDGNVLDRRVYAALADIEVGGIRVEVLVVESPDNG